MISGIEQPIKRSQRYGFKMSEPHDEICPNCMEPVPAGVDVCPSCGVKMNEFVDTPAADLLSAAKPAPAIEPPAKNDAVPGEAPGGAKAKKPGMMQNLTRGLGIYLLYFAITNGYKVLSDPKALNLTPGTREYWLSLVSNVIYLAAGLLAVWPWIKEWIEKRKRAGKEIAAEAKPASLTIEGTVDPVPSRAPVLEEEDASLDEIREAAAAELASGERGDGE